MPSSVTFWASLIIGIWAAGNGLLHDFFVLAGRRGKPYDRELLRLLMDGHILLTCGVMQCIASAGIGRGEAWGFAVAATAAVSLLIYCGLIFPFLKSLLTMLLNAGLVVLLIVGWP